MRNLDTVKFETMWNESKYEEVGFLEKHFKGFDPTIPYEPLTTAELKRRRLKIKTDGTKNIRTYEV